MEFRVRTPDETVHYFHKSSRYSITDGGVLEVKDEDGKTIAFGPAGWLCVEEDNPAKPVVTTF